MRIAYARVSTDLQSLASQLDQLGAAGCDRIFSDKGVSGAKAERKGLNEALAALSPGDTLVVCRLDRLGRSLKFLVDLIEDLKARQCGFISLNDGIDTTTSTGELVYQILAVIAQFERTLVSERTRAGMKAARARGKRCGRPPSLSKDDILSAYRRVQEDEEPISHVARDLGVCHDTIVRGFRRFDLAA